MIKLSTRVFTTLILLQTTHLMAMEPEYKTKTNLIAKIKPYKEDIELSKKSFPISGDLFSENNRTKGAMTLCFKTIKTRFGFIEYEYEHAALVFEFFNPFVPDEVSLTMIHYVGDQCVPGMPRVESRKATLSKVYRGIKIDVETGQKRYFPATYKRYASWVLPNKDLIKGYKLACTDVDAHERDMARCNYSCVSYVQRIMRAVGLSEVDFGIWPKSAGNLKRLVNPNFG